MNFTKEELNATEVPTGKIVFLGSNPSCSSPYNDPFSHCKSANKMLNAWIPALGLTRAQVHFMNVANYKTEGNRPLRRAEVVVELPRLVKLLEGQIVVTLGKTAKEAMDMVAYFHEQVTIKDFIGVDVSLVPMPPRKVIEMPHPSGRNRLLNDKDFVARMLESSRKSLEAAVAEGEADNTVRNTTQETR